jgi:hypothetical protein
MASGCGAGVANAAISDAASIGVFDDLRGEVVVWRGSERGQFAAIDIAPPSRHTAARNSEKDPPTTTGRMALSSGY